MMPVHVSACHDAASSKKVANRSASVAISSFVRNFLDSSSILSGGGFTCGSPVAVN